MSIPKDRQIIIECGLGAGVAIWNDTDKSFVFANLQIDLFEGKWNDTYFENEYVQEKDITKWREL